MKKVVKLTAAAAIALTLTGCGNNDDAAGAEEDIVIRYANWNLGTEEENNLQRQRIQAFEEAHPNITIEIDERFTGDDWMETLATAASAGNLPDVFMLNDAPTSAANDWLLDITELAKNDEEFTALQEVIRESAMQNETVYAVPYGQFLLGYFVNKDLFNDLNMDVLEYGFSLEEFEAAVRGATDLSRPMVGTNFAGALMDWYAGVVNPEMGWFTLNDGTYSLDSEEMIAGMSLARDLGSNGFDFSGLTDEQRDEFTGEWDGDAFMAGQIGLQHAGMWMINDLAQNAEFEWDFIGIPGGRPALTVDQLGIAQTTEHPEEAFEFAKWMGFGKEGTLAAFDIAAEQGLQFGGLPVSTDSEVLDRYWEIMTVPGIRAAYERLDEALIDGNKIIPGYVQSRWQATTGFQINDDIENATIGDILWHSIYGTLNFRDFATQVNDLAQENHDSAMEAIMAR